MAVPLGTGGRVADDVICRIGDGGGGCGGGGGGAGTEGAAQVIHQLAAVGFVEVEAELVPARPDGRRGGDVRGGHAVADGGEQLGVAARRNHGVEVGG